MDDGKLPDDLAYLEPKLKNNHFTVQKLQANQDQELQDRLKEIEEDRPIRRTASRPSNGTSKTTRTPAC